MVGRHMASHDDWRPAELSKLPYQVKNDRDILTGFLLGFLAIELRRHEA